MQRLLIVLSFILFISCSQNQDLAAENEQLRSEVENLEEEVTKVQMQAEGNLKEAARQRTLAVEARAEAAALAAELAKCNGQ